MHVNGQDCGIAWRPPYQVDIVLAQNRHEQHPIEVANTWVNRLIGEEQHPLDIQSQGWESFSKWPGWFLNKTPRPTPWLHVYPGSHMRKYPDTRSKPLGSGADSEAY